MFKAIVAWFKKVNVAEYEDELRALKVQNRHLLIEAENLQQIRVELHNKLAQFTRNRVLNRRTLSVSLRDEWVGRENAEVAGAILQIVNLLKPMPVVAIACPFETCNMEGYCKKRCVWCNTPTVQVEITSIPIFECLSECAYTMCNLRVKSILEAVGALVNKQPVIADFTTWSYRDMLAAMGCMLGVPMCVCTRDKEATIIRACTELGVRCPGCVIQREYIEASNMLCAPMCMQYIDEVVQKVKLLKKEEDDKNNLTLGNE